MKRSCGAICWGVIIGHKGEIFGSWGDMSNKAQGGLATVKYALNDVLQTDTDLRGISVTVFLCREHSGEHI